MSNGRFFLTKSKVKGLFFYYTVLIIVSILVVLYTLVNEGIDANFKLTITELSLLGGMGTALIGCCIFYLRKLYKGSINNELVNPVTEEEKYKQLGILIYFLLRPLFSVVFSLLVHIILKSSVHIITVKEARLDEGFIYLTMVLSFFVGFASGDVITFLEQKSKDIAIKHLSKNV
jgi:hypothetical protein